MGPEIEEELEVNVEEEGQETSEGEEINEENEESTTQEEQDSEEQDSKDDTEGQDEEVQFLGIKDVKKAYPDFFKKFPSLKHRWFQADQYRKIFGSVDDAKEAMEVVEEHHNLISALSSGSIEDVGRLLNNFKEMGDDVLPSLAQNFLPALAKANPDAYYDAITPELQSFARRLYQAGVKNGNENLKNAGLLAAQFYFDDMEIASGGRNVQTREIAKKDDKLEKERNDFRAERYTIFSNEVNRGINSQVTAIITKGLDPKNTMSDGMKEMITEKVSKQIDKILGADSAHLGKMRSLWKKAETNKFSSNDKSRIIEAYLERAQEIMPEIRSKVRSSILGTGRRENGRREPSNNAGNGSLRAGNPREINTKQIDWSKTSDLDIMNGKITYKK